MTNIALIICLFLSSTDPSVRDLIDLSKVYNEYQAPSKALSKAAEATINKQQGTTLLNTALFIKEICTSNNDILRSKYLSKPDQNTLQNFHIICKINYRLFLHEDFDTTKFTEDLLEENLSPYESLSIYYQAIFASAINKNRPYDFSNLNFRTDTLKFSDQQEKGIFFLEFVDRLGFQIIAFVKYAKKPNYSSGYDYLNKMPKIDGKAYYFYSDFDFPDQTMFLNSKKQSYKNYHMEMYYEVLLSHFKILTNNAGTISAAQELVSSSILSNKSYYKYCRNRVELGDILKSINN